MKYNFIIMPETDEEWMEYVRNDPSIDFEKWKSMAFATNVPDCTATNVPDCTGDGIDDELDEVDYYDLPF